MDRPPQPGFTIEDILAEAAAQEDGEGGKTTRELMELTGRGPCWVHAQLRRLIASGEARCVGKRPQSSIDGVPRYAPVYKLTASPRVDSEEK